VLAIAITLAAALRGAGLPAESPWHDEVLSLRALDQPDLASFWEQLRAEDAVATLAPLYFTLEHLWSRVAGTDATNVRCLSILFSLLSLPVIYLIGRRLFGPVAGCVAALCLGLSLPGIFYGQEIRMYSLVSFLALLSVATLLLALERGHVWWIVHGVVNALLVWSHLFAGLVVAAEGLFLLLCCWRKPTAWLAWTVLHVALAAGTAAYVRVLVSQGMAQGASWMPLPTWREAANTFVVLAGGRFSNEDPRPYLVTGVSLDLVLAGVLLFLAVLLCLRQFLIVRPRAGNGLAERSVAATVLLLLWLGLPTAVLLAVSYLYAPCFMYRYVLYSAPPLYLMAGGALATSRRVTLPLVAVGILTVAYAYQFMALPLPFRPDYRMAAELVDRAGSPDDPILVYKAINVLPFQFAAGDAASRVIAIEGENELRVQVLGRAVSGSAPWVIMWRWDKTEEFERFLRRSGLRFTTVELGGMPRVHVYHIQERILPGGDLVASRREEALHDLFGKIVDAHVPVRAV